MKAFIFSIILFITPQICLSEEKLVAGLFNIVPYAYEENNKVVGITTEIIESIKEDSSLEIKMILMPYRRMLKELKSGKIDFAIFFLSDYSNTFSYNLISLYDLDTVVIGKKTLTIHSFDDLYHIRLATPLGVNYNKGLANNKKLNIHYVRDYKNAILMLKKGNIDAIIAPSKILEYQLGLMGMNINELGEPYILTTNTAWIQFSHKSTLQKYKPLLIETAQKLLEEDRVIQIIRKYYPD